LAAAEGRCALDFRLRRNDHEMFPRSCLARHFGIWQELLFREWEGLIAMNIDVGRKAIAEATEKLKNWGRWGKDDQIGTLNHVTPQDIVRAAGLIRIDRRGPQSGLWGGRWNPIHTMLATGTDAVAGRHDKVPGIRYADDALNMPVQSATHWDSLGHIFYEDKMYNGFDAREADSNGLRQLGIEHTKNKMVGRGVLLDIARFRGVPWLEDGEAIGNGELDKCAKDQNVEIRRGDFVILRTGQMERCLKEKQWGSYAGGDAPGVKFENCYWCHEREIAAICSDTWGVEVRPNETKEVGQPWHWVVIPAMGLTMGEMFYVKELAEDCEADGVYEFFFCGAPLIITGGTGSPINPQAIK
jgi:kynurenine formamidase